MKARGRRAVLLCAMTALLALPAGAGAQTPEVRPGSYFLEIELPESNGWRMSLTALNRRQIRLTAERGAMEVQYRVPGRASSRLVKADFGPLGRVDLRMDLEARPSFSSFDRKRERAERCRGKNQVALTGRFHGVVDFDGEQKVAGVFARKGDAFIERRWRQVCRPPASKRSKGGEPRGELLFEISFLAARAHEGGRTTSLEAFGIGFESKVFLGAVSGTVHERLGQVKILRRATELIGDPEIRIKPNGKKAQTARIEPLEPFTGSASYLKKAGSPATWTGNLAVPLPGIGKVPLAGPGFDARLCHARWFGEIEGTERCLLESRALSFAGGPARLLRELYGSGSHSQPLALARLSSLR